jgi:hypothetical protein
MYKETGGKLKVSGKNSFPAFEFPAAATAKHSACKVH